MRKTVRQAKLAGATVLPHIYTDALWSQGIAENGTADGIPIYDAKPTDPLLRSVCTMYNTHCNARDLIVHVPSYAVAQQASDGHITIVDPAAVSGPVEVDCWQAQISHQQLRCSWAGAYDLGSAGTSNNGSEGIHAGMAVTTVAITGSEVLDGHINHVLGMTARCLNDPPTYPADQTNGTDTPCDSTRDAPHYGNLLHLLWSQERILHSEYSASCKTILAAFSNYGAYLVDTGNNGLQLNTQSDLSYIANPVTKAQDPWPTVQFDLNSAGDGIGDRWSSCLNRLQAADFELLQIRRS